MKININNLNLQNSNFKNAKLNYTNNSSHVSFGSTPEEMFGRYISKNNITYINADKLTQTLDEVFGKDYFFSTHLKKAGIKSVDNNLTVERSTFLKDLGRTILYPVREMPMDIFNAMLEGLRKINMDKTADFIVNSKAIKPSYEKYQAQKSYDIVSSILSKFADVSESDKIDVHKDIYSKMVNAGVGTVAKNYKSRDERTLNRAATATVSAIYSAHDFYNISLLENDDKSKAKNAEKARFKQEMTRMSISAGLTFFSLGVFEKYTKSSVLLNSLVIASSALISEVTSRLVHHVPLAPLSSEQAKELAENNEAILNAKNAPEKDSKKDINDFRKKEIFGIFAENNKGISPDEKVQYDNVNGAPESKTKKNKKNTKSWLTAAFVLANILFIVKKGLCKDFYSKALRQETLLRNKRVLDKYIEKSQCDNVGTKVAKKLTDINEKEAQFIKKYDFLKTFKRNLTTKKETINLEELKKEIDRLKATPEAQCISAPLEYYSNAVGHTLGNEVYTLDSRVDRFLIPGLYNGLSKIPQIIYTVFSAPAQLIYSLINKVKYDETEKVAKKVLQKYEMQHPNSKYGIKQKEKDIKEVYQIFKTYKNRDNKIINVIKNRTRNFEVGGETGALANLSRTMVTLISTYFFVNDYRNKVLIESKGRNVDEANEVRNQRIAHKLSNFIINGTLMNLFNSIGKVPLNSSLVAATIIAAGTEFCNEFLIRKSICQPIGKMDSKQAIIDFEEEKLSKKGFVGWWTRTFKKITGKKSLTQKTGIKTQNTHS